MRTLERSAIAFAFLFSIVMTAGKVAAEEEEECLPCGEEKNGLLGGLLGAPEEQGLRPGEAAPAFVLPFLDGERKMRSEEVFPAHDLTVLILWDSHCPHCLRTLVESGAFAARADSLGVGMLSINFDQEHMSAVRAFVKGEKLPFPVLWDADGKVARQYWIATYDFSLFLIDRKGIIRYVHYDRPDNIVRLLDAEGQKVLTEDRERVSPSSQR